MNPGDAPCLPFPWSLLCRLENLRIEEGSGARWPGRLHGAALWLYIRLPLGR